MLCSNTKIVVIGSNSIARSSPRVGSIGYIYSAPNIKNYDSNIKSLSNTVASCNVIFSRLGYRARKIPELHNVLLTLPRIASNNSAKKVLNRAIADVNADKGGLRKVIVAPLIMPEESTKDYALKLAIKGYNSNLTEYLYKVRCVKDNVAKSNWPIDKITAQLADMPDEVYNALYHLAFTRPPSCANDIYRCLGNDINLYRYIDNFLSITSLMRSRGASKKINEKKPFWKKVKLVEKDTSIGGDKVFSTGYSNYDIFNMFDDWRKHAYEGVYYNALNNLRSELIKRGIETVNKY